MPRDLSELSGIAVSMVANAILDADVPDEVLAQRITDEADPLFVTELGLALTHQKFLLWIRAERRKAQRRIEARRLGPDQKR
jgi:hypothetical protein